MNPILKTAFAVLTLSAASIGLAPDSPAQSTPATQAEIRFDRADLIDPVRLDALRARIEATARNVCRDALLGDLLRPVTLQSCIRDATDRAFDQLSEHRATVLAVADVEPAEQRR